MPKETNDERIKRELDLELDQELDATFPASDALKITMTRPKKSDTPEQVGDERTKGPLPR